MTHIQLDDAFFDHPKVLSVSEHAKILCVAAICYCGRELTDGFIPTGAVVVLAAKTGVRRPQAAAIELVNARLWETTEGGYRAHDYLDYNTKSDKVKTDRAAAKDRMRQLRSRNVRPNNERTDDEQSAKFAKCSPEVRDSTTTTTTNGSKEPIYGDDDPLNKSLPENGPEQKIVAAFCRAAGIERPASYARAVGQAKQLSAAGITPDEIPDLFDYASRVWHDGVDLGNLLLSVDRWRSRPKTTRLVAQDGTPFPPEIERLRHDNARRLKWENDHRSQPA